jgi:hypothetical protein
MSGNGNIDPSYTNNNNNISGNSQGQDLNNTNNSS